MLAILLLAALVGLAACRSQVKGECVYTIEKDSLVVNGQGSWEGVSLCWDVMMTSTSLVITNTGPVAPINFRLLSGLPITSLSLSNLHIESLSVTAFDGLSSLVDLDLSYNFIRHMPTVNGGYRPTQLETLDLTGNPLERGCFPVEVSVFPQDALPPCNGHDELMQRLLTTAGPVLEELPSPEVLERFICDEDSTFLTQEVLHVYKVGIAVGRHYGLIFVFPNGMMLSDLTVPLFTQSNHIKSTCIRFDTTDQKISQEDMATLMFTLHCPLWRTALPKHNPYQLRDYLLKYRCLALEDKPLSGITGQEIVRKIYDYQRGHPTFIPDNIDSCITFAHVFYRDLGNAGLIN